MMKKFNLRDEELKELLRVTLREEPSSNLTENVMLKITLVQEEQISKRAIENKRRNIMVVFALVSTFTINIIILFSGLNSFLRDLTSLFADYTIEPLLDTLQLTIGLITLAFGIWILIYMEKKSHTANR